MMSEKLLVKCGCDVDERDRLVVILVELRPLREPSVHRMAGLVRERVNVGENVALIVHQDVGRRAKAARGKCTAPFPFRFVAIAPPTAQTFAQGRYVFGTEWFKRLQNSFGSFVEGNMGFDLRDQRNVGVVMVQLIQTEDAASELVIAEEGADVVSHGGDQPVINR